jgi:hypothetical protein
VLRPADGPRLAEAPLHEQLSGVESALLGNRIAVAILERAPHLHLPGWYLGAGGVAQTIWNQLHGFDPEEGIKDYDLVYFDPTDLSVEAERAVEARVDTRCADLAITLDVKNEARVHLWYGERFGRTIEPYRSTEHAISTWPTTASSVGVHVEDGRFDVCAPFGLRDVFAMVARPNKTIVSREVYEEKVARWAARWPRLTVLPW